MKKFEITLEEKGKKVEIELPVTEENGVTKIVVTKELAKQLVKKVKEVFSIKDIIKMISK